MIDDNLLRQACSPLLKNPSLAVEDERLGWFVDLCKAVSEKAKEKQMEEEEEEGEGEGEAQGGSMDEEEEEEEEAPPSPTPLSRDEMRSMLERAETLLRKEDGEGTRSLEEAVRLATCVLDHFPDSARGLRSRGLARAARLSASAEEGKEWGEGCDDLVEGCIADLSKAQSIDYDHGAQVALTRAIEVKEERRRRKMVLRKEEEKAMSAPFAPKNGQEGGSVTGNDFQSAMKSMMQNPDVLRTAQEMLKDPSTLRSISEMAKGMARGIAVMSASEESYDAQDLLKELAELQKDIEQARYGSGRMDPDSMAEELASKSIPDTKSVAFSSVQEALGAFPNPLPTPPAPPSPPTAPTGLTEPTPSPSPPAEPTPPLPPSQEPPTPLLPPPSAKEEKPDLRSCKAWTEFEDEIGKLTKKDEELRRLLEEEAVKKWSEKSGLADSLDQILNGYRVVLLQLKEVLIRLTCGSKDDEERMNSIRRQVEECSEELEKLAGEVKENADRMANESYFSKAFRMARQFGNGLSKLLRSTLSFIRRNYFMLSILAIAALVVGKGMDYNHIHKLFGLEGDWSTERTGGATGKINLLTQLIGKAVTKGLCELLTFEGGYMNSALFYILAFLVLVSGTPWLKAYIFEGDTSRVSDDDIKLGSHSKENMSSDAEKMAYKKAYDELKLFVRSDKRSTTFLQRLSVVLTFTLAAVGNKDYLLKTLLPYIAVFKSLSWVLSTVSSYTVCGTLAYNWDSISLGLTSYQTIDTVSEFTIVKMLLGIADLYIKSSGLDENYFVHTLKTIGKYTPQIAGVGVGLGHSIYKQTQSYNPSDPGVQAIGQFLGKMQSTLQTVGVAFTNKYMLLMLGAAGAYAIHHYGFEATDTAETMEKKINGKDKLEFVDGTNVERNLSDLKNAQNSFYSQIKIASPGGGSSRTKYGSCGSYSERQKMKPSLADAFKHRLDLLVEIARDAMSQTAGGGGEGRSQIFDNDHLPGTETYKHPLDERKVLRVVEMDPSLLKRVVDDMRRRNEACQCMEMPGGKSLVYVATVA